MKFEISNLDEVISELKKQIEATGNSQTILPKLNAGYRERYEDKHAETNFALFKGKKPVSFDEYAQEVLNAFQSGLLAEEAGLVMIELRHLKKFYPNEYQAWLTAGIGGKEDAEGNPQATPGVSTSDWKGNKAVLPKINELLSKATIAASGGQKLKLNDYDARMAEYGLPGAPITNFANKSINEIKSELELTWNVMCRDLIQTKLSPDAFNPSPELINRFASATKGSTCALAGKDSNGKRFALVGKLYYNSTWNKATTEFPGTTIIIAEDVETELEVKSISIDKAQVGHTSEGATQGGEYSYLALKEMKRKIESKGTLDEPEKILLQGLDNALATLDPVYKQIYGSNRVVLSPSALALKNVDGRDLLSKEFPKLIDEASKLGVDEMMIFYSTEGTTIQGRVVKLPFQLSASVFVPQYWLDNETRGGGFATARGALVKSTIESISANALGPALTFKQGSSSPLEQALLLALQDSLQPLLGDDRNVIKKKIVRQSPKGKKKLVEASVKRKRSTKKMDANDSIAIAKVVDARIKKRVKEIRDGIISTGRAKIQKNRSGRIKGTMAAPGELMMGSNSSIVDMINRELKAAVIEQMRSPALINRTGRFAESVRVTSADNNALRYSYKRDPYAVFSRRIGKSPWNNHPDRDPQKIIKKAITSILRNKFPDAFKTDNNIVEGN